MQVTEPSAFTAPERAILDVCGRRRSPATFADFHKGRPPMSKGQTYPADPPTIAEIVALMNACPDTVSGRRLRALIIVLWRSGLRISEALALRETDLNPREHSIIVREGKGGKRRLVGMCDLGWHQLEPWLQERQQLPVGTVFPVVLGASTGRQWSASGARTALRKVAKRSGVRRRIHFHGLRHAHASELWREKVDLYTIMQQLGHSDPRVTVTYLKGITNLEAVEAIAARKPPMVPAL